MRIVRAAFLIAGRNYELGALPARIGERDAESFGKTEVFASHDRDYCASPLNGACMAGR